MSGIWPAGPPKLFSPISHQTRTASRNGIPWSWRGDPAGDGSLRTNARLPTNGRSLIETGPLCNSLDPLFYNHMVVDHEAGTARTDRIFRALADPTRRAIVARALQGEHSVSALAAHHPMSFAAVQKHVAVLERAGLVTKQRRGREQLVRADIAAIRESQRVLERLETIWRERMERFEDTLADTTRQGDTR